MLKVYVPSDCGNAPKKEKLVNFNIAFSKGQVNEILSYLADDVVWEKVGDKVVHGKSKMKIILEEMAAFKANELHIFQVITHGKDASIRGILKFDNQKIAFADYYEFSSAGSKTIKHLTSYAIVLK